MILLVTLSQYITVFSAWLVILCIGVLLFYKKMQENNAEYVIDMDKEKYNENLYVYAAWYIALPVLLPALILPMIFDIIS